MKRSSLVAGLGIVVLAIGALGWILGTRGSGAHANVAAAFPPQSSGSERVGNNVSERDPILEQKATETGRGGADSDATRVMPVAASTLSATEFEGAQRGDLVLLAKSPAEFDWLRHNGYPELDRWRGRGAVSDAELENGIRRGDLVDQVILAERTAIKGDLQRALDLFEDAQVRGSVFAYLVEAQVLHQRDRQLDQRPEWMSVRPPARANGLAAVQMALLLGDHQAGQVMRAMGMQNVDASRVAAAMQAAGIALANLNASRLQRGLPPLSVTARPGAADWMPDPNPASRMAITYWRPPG